ncbi:MAG: hypothetical protein IH853_09740 [Bacteroidetes bacterium]|nr:hypothetical protein [Bacteroidota bacterium]
MEARKNPTSSSSIFATICTDGANRLFLAPIVAPTGITGIEERLLSRIRWGLSADVQPPDLERRIAILLNHAKRYGFDLSGDVIDFMA